MVYLVYLHLLSSTWFLWFSCRYSPYQFCGSNGSGVFSILAAGSQKKTIYAAFGNSLRPMASQFPEAVNVQTGGTGKHPTTQNPLRGETELPVVKCCFFWYFFWGMPSEGKKPTFLWAPPPNPSKFCAGFISVVFVLFEFVVEKTRFLAILPGPSFRALNE